MEGGKFIGGSALARKRARNVKFTRKVPAGQIASKKTPMLPKRVSASERFFASLLLNSKDDLISSKDCKHWNRVIGNTCNRAGVPFPSALNATDDDAKTFFLMRASLVLEEARGILVDELCNNFKMMKNCTKCGIHVKLSYFEKRKYGSVGLFFQKRSGCSFTPSELYELKPGCVVEVIFRDESSRMRSILTNITPMFGGSDGQVVALSAYGMEDVMQYFHDDMDFFLLPVATLISEQRQFTACYERPKVNFISKLMGMKTASHIRFDDSDNESESVKDEHKNDQNLLLGEREVSIGDKNDLVEEKKESDSETMSHDFHEDDRVHLSSIKLPTLNATQEKAAFSYLNGPRDNLFLVQGPPGTG